MKNLIITVIFLTGSAMADDLTIPNTFQAGTPARAAEVNGNFSAVEASVDDNAADIANVSQNVATYAQNISSNAQNTSSNAQNISSNAQNISSNDQDIDAVVQSISSIIAPSTFNFVGFSSAQLDGGAGHFGMNSACQADFGPDSRMASSAEIIESTIQPTLSASFAWVRPEIVAAGTFIVDFSGQTRGNSLNCFAWSTNSGGAGFNYGLTVLPNGGFQLRICHELHPVACSISQ